MIRPGKRKSRLGCFVNIEQRGGLYFVRGEIGGHIMGVGVYVPVENVPLNGLSRWQILRREMKEIARIRRLWADDLGRFLTFKDFDRMGTAERVRRGLYARAA